MKKIMLFLVIITLASCASVSNSTDNDRDQINLLLNQWHKAAAEADANNFFDKFTEDGIYIGTDASEHWTAKELQQWSVKAFEQKPAWDFKSYDRHIYFSEDSNVAWFDELLDTWMGPCRGSGVLKKVAGKWKIAHYHLSIAVPNDKVDAYLDLLKKD